MNMKKGIIVIMILSLMAFALSTTCAYVERGKYNKSLLINWTDAAIQEAYGMKAADFVPSDPQPLTYIACCEPVIDPRTGKEATTGWSSSDRTEPASAETVLNMTADLSDFYLTLTDDPNQATYRAVITYKYKRSNNDFNYSQENARIPMYSGTLTLTLQNMLTGESLQTIRDDCWCFPEQTIEKRVLDRGIGKQFYGGPRPVKQEEMNRFRDFLGLGVETLFDYKDDEDGGICITGYRGDDTGALVIPDTILGKPVTGISQYAFSHDDFSAITLPDSLTHIENNAFRDCHELTSIIIPSSVTSIGYEAFNYCKKLKQITLPEGLTEIPSAMFLESGITSIEIPNTVTRIGKEAFKWCESLKSIVIPEGVCEIGEGAFIGCDALTDVICLGEIEKIEDSAFAYCKQLTSVSFRGLKVLGNAAFSCDSALRSVYLPETLSEIGNGAFLDFDNNKQENFTIKDLVLTVVEGSFAEQWAKEQGVNYVSGPAMTEAEFAELTEAINNSHGVEAILDALDDPVYRKTYDALLSGEIVKEGSKGETAKGVQKTLVALGQKISVDGNVGPKTIAALNAAQSALGLPTTEEVDAEAYLQLLEGLANEP